MATPIQLALVRRWEQAAKFFGTLCSHAPICGGLTQ
jgi:hypothetical protein